jgi:hypothetical protein
MATNMAKSKLNSVYEKLTNKQTYLNASTAQKVALAITAVALAFWLIALPTTISTAVYAVSSMVFLASSAAVLAGSKRSGEQKEINLSKAKEFILAGVIVLGLFYAPLFAACIAAGIMLYQVKQQGSLADMIQTIRTKGSGLFNQLFNSGNFTDNVKTVWNNSDWSQRVLFGIMLASALALSSAVWSATSLLCTPLVAAVVLTNVAKEKQEVVAAEEKAPEQEEQTGITKYLNKGWKALHKNEGAFLAVVIILSWLSPLAGIVLATAELSQQFFDVDPVERGVELVTVVQQQTAGLGTDVDAPSAQQGAGNSHDIQLP